MGSLFGASPASAQIQAGQPGLGLGRRWATATPASSRCATGAHAGGELWLDPHSASYGPGRRWTPRSPGRSATDGADVRIWLPPQYTQRAYRNHLFPVLDRPDRVPGKSEAWWSLADIPRVAEAAIADGSMPPFVLVAVNPDIVPPRDTECTDVPGGPAVQTFLHSDLPIDVVHLLSAEAPGRDWALMGDSTGGYCATLLAMRYPGSSRPR